MQLTEHERTIVTDRVAAVEARTGTQVVTAVIGKSDSYPEAPWKAFALGAGAAALACALWQVASGAWAADASPLIHVPVILGSGVILALSCVLCPPFARLFIDGHRRDMKVMQFAQALFFRHRLDRTRGRFGILVLISLFERKVVILADTGFDGRIDPADWSGPTRRIALLMRHAKTAVALRAGLDALEAILLASGFCRSETANELPDAVLQMKGPA
jgi:putative membrane protein